MRNKKLISMLMLSAGFAACTQDELVDTPNVNNEGQKDLVEDVVLNVSFEEDAITRAAYAGGATELNEDGSRANYEVFQNFYLEPAWGDGKTSFTLSNQEKLAGDMIGFCLNLNGQAITNYPFYIAGYNTADKVETNEDGQEVRTSKVYGLAAQTGLYDLGVAAGNFEVAEAADITASIAAVGKILKGEDGKWGDHTALALDVRKGIVRTNAGIMTGQYIAYFPYNADFTDPNAIPAVGKEKLLSIYTADLAEDRETALQNVKFYDYLFANAREAAEVKGGTKAGNAKLVPQTSALTFAFTNTAAEPSTTIKRITVKAATEGDKPFILEGSVSLDNLNAVKAESTTNLIGVGFTPALVPAATVDAEGQVTDQEWRYVTIPYMANATDGKYIIEIYNTNGEIATIEWTPKNALGCGKALVQPIDLNRDFKPGVRKIFTNDELAEEIVAGGELELMAPVILTENVTVGTAEQPVNVTILGSNQLIISNGTINGNIVSENARLILQGGTVNGNVNAKDVSFQAAKATVNGNIAATETLNVDGTTITVSGTSVTQTSAYEQNPLYALSGKFVSLTGGSYKNLKAEESIAVYGNVTVDAGWPGDLPMTEVKTKQVTVGANATLNVVWMVAESLQNNGGTVNVNNHMVVNTLNNVTSVVGSTTYVGTVNVTGAQGLTCESGTTVLTNNANAVVNWSKSAMDIVVENHGTLTLAEAVSSITGKLTNKNGETKIEGDVQGNGKGSLTVDGGFVKVMDNLNINDFTVTVNGGELFVDVDATLSGRSKQLVVNGGRVVKKTNNSNFMNVANGSADTFAPKFNVIQVSETVSNISNLSQVIADKIELLSGSSLTISKTNLSHVYVLGDATLKVNDNSTAKSLTINQGCKLTVETKSGKTLNVDKDNETGIVTNNGTYDGQNAVVNCYDFVGNGVWVNNVTPNC